MTTEVQRILDYLAQYEAEAPTTLFLLKALIGIEMLKIDLIYVGCR